MDGHSSEPEGADSRMSREEANSQLLPDDHPNRENKITTNLLNQYSKPCEDNFPSVDEDDNLDDEVRACLVGLSGLDLSSSPSSFMMPGSGSQVDSMSSFYSVRTLKDTDTDTANYFSVDTLTENEGGKVQRTEVQVEEVQGE